MIPNIVRGPNMAGLMTYLVGPGRENVHTEPHLVTGDAAIMAWHDNAELSHLDALDIASQIDQPRKVFGTKVMVPNYLRDAAGNEILGPNGKPIKNPDKPLRDGNVWHCSLSLEASEGQLTDEQWAAIADDFMDRMGFTAASGKSPARWVAVRHGLSAKGNDHIHIAASAVREDGTKVSTWNDYNRSQTIAGELERKYGLAVIVERGKSPSIPGYSPAEVATAKRRGETETDRDVVRRAVRACAVASKTEDEFVRRMRRSGLAVQPRFASGRADVITGYSVGIKPRNIGGVWETRVRFGGSELAPELALPALRDSCGWERTPETADAAVAEWTAAKRHRPIVEKNGRETRPITDPELIKRAAEDLRAWNKYLTSIPDSDHARWAHAAGRTAGILSAWASRVDPEIGKHLARASIAVERSAQVYPNQRWQRPAGTKPDMAGSVALILFQSKNLSKATGWVLLLKQLTKTLEAIRDAQKARGELNRALELDRAVRVELVAVRAGLPRGSEPNTTLPTDPPAPRLDPELQRVRDAVAAQSGRRASEVVQRRDPGSPVPNKLKKVEPVQPTHAAPTAPQRDEGVER